MPTFGSLFAGIGGIDLGLERAGWTGRWQVEWDEYCQHVLAHHWPDIPRYGDIATVDWSTVEPVDLLAGGFPCQPVSGAGKQKAQGDERWLWPEFHRAIRALRPGLVLVENVSNILAVNDGSAFAEVLGDLAASGYDAEWDVVPASAVGAPHSRERLWIVAYPRRLGVRTNDQSDEASRTPRTAEGEASQRQWRGDDARGRGPTVADAHGGEPPLEGTSGRVGRIVEPRVHRGSFGRGSAWTTEPVLGGIVDGFSGGLDRRWPARPGERQYEWEPTRINADIPNRMPRLKALGNAVVPQVVEVIGRRLLEIA